MSTYKRRVLAHGFILKQTTIHPYFKKWGFLVDESVKLMENKFPEYHSIIPEKCEYRAVVNKDKLKDILKHITAFMTQKIKIATFLFSPNNLLMEE